MTASLARLAAATHIPQSYEQHADLSDVSAKNIHAKQITLSDTQDFTNWVDRLEIEPTGERLKTKVATDELYGYHAFSLAYNSESVLSSQTKSKVHQFQQSNCDNLIGRPLWLRFRNCQDL